MGSIIVFGFDVSPLALIRILWKRKLTALLIWAAASAATFAYVETLPAVYSTSAVIALDSQKIPERYVSATVNSDVQEQFSAISQQILSSSRLKKIIDQFNLYAEDRRMIFPEEIFERMRRDILIAPEKSVASSRLGAFRITYQGSDPVVVAQVANQIANLYIEENLKSREEQAGGTSEFIDAQLQTAKETLDQLETTVSSYKVTHNGELPQQEGTLNGILNRLQAEFEANREAANRAQITKVSLEHSLAAAEENLQAQLRLLEGPATPGSVSSPARDEADTPQVKPSEVLKAELKTMRSRYSDEHPDVVQLKRRIERAEAVEAAEAAREPVRASVRPSAPATSPAEPRRVREAIEVRQIRDRIASFQNQLTLTKQEIETRKTDQRRILADMNNYQTRVTRLPIREQEMSQITRDYDMAKAHYRSLLDKKVAADMAADMERRQKAERFTIIDTARVPAKPARPNRPLLRAAGSAAGLLLGILFAFAGEIRTNPLLGEWQVPAGVPVIGRIPHIAGPNLPPAARSKRRFWFRKKEALS